MGRRGWGRAYGAGGGGEGVRGEQDWRWVRWEGRGEEVEGERTRRVEGVDFNFLILGRLKGKRRTFQHKFPLYARTFPSSKISLFVFGE